MLQNPFSFDCFGDALRKVQERADHKNIYAVNPAFDR